jgi:hypothetical protein
MAKNETTTTPYSYQWWIAQIERDEKRLRDGWHNYAKKIVKRYKDNRKDEQRRTNKLNLFWTNVGIMKAALYAKPPKPMVSRMWGDANDQVGRVAGLMIQRYLSADMRDKDSQTSASIKLAVEDRLVAGLGTVWLRYDPTIVTREVPEVLLPDGTVLSPAQQYEDITDEKVVTEYVFWEDIIYPSARTPDEVWYKARRIYKSKNWIEKRFGKKIAANLQELTGDSYKENSMLPKNFTLDKVEFIEAWCKKTKKIYWFSKYCPGKLMGEADDPLNLTNFYPSPDFLMATHSTDDYIPRPDYYMVKDQYDALDNLNSRISLLEGALRVVGVYDKKNDELKQLLTTVAENSMVPVTNFAMLGERGGLKGSVDWFPLEQVVLVLEKLTAQKAQKIEEIYMLTGISDIMRGQTNANETLGAQQIKAQYSSVRLQFIQDEVANFARQILALKAEIACKHFQPETWLKITEVQNTEDAQMAEPAVQLLSDWEKLNILVDINEESLALPDYNQERDMRVEFLTTIGQFLSQAQGVIQSMPQAMPYMVQMIKWVSAGFRGSSEIQGVLDQAFAALSKNPPQPPAPPDPMKDPRVITTQMKIQSDQAIAQGKGQLDQGKAMLDNRTKVQVQQMSDQTDLQIAGMGGQLEQQKNQMTQQNMMMEASMNNQQMNREHQLSREKSSSDARLKTMTAMLQHLIKMEQAEAAREGAENE